ncbi:hypothetical protein Dimus_011344, partial [Dionaea muscipula]
LKPSSPPSAGHEEAYDDDTCSGGSSTIKPIHATTRDLKCGPICDLRRLSDQAFHRRLNNIEAAQLQQLSA